MNGPEAKTGPEIVRAEFRAMLTRHGATRQQIDEWMPRVAMLARFAEHPDNEAVIRAQIAALDAQLDDDTDQHVGRLHVGPGTQQ